MLIRKQDPILYNIKTLIIFEITQPFLEKFIGFFSAKIKFVNELLNSSR